MERCGFWQQENYMQWTNRRDNITDGLSQFCCNALLDCQTNIISKKFAKIKTKNTFVVLSYPNIQAESPNWEFLFF